MSHSLSPAHLRAKGEGVGSPQGQEGWDMGHLRAKGDGMGSPLGKGDGMGWDGMGWDGMGW